MSLAIGGALAAALAVGLFSTLGSPSGNGTVASFTAPNLFGGPPVALPALGAAEHRPVVVTVFGSWCAPCQAELPMVAAFARSAVAQRTHVLFIGVDEVDPDVSAARAFVRRSGVGFPVAQDLHESVAAALSVPGTPSTYFIDASGVVRKIIPGAVTESELRTWVTRLG